MNETRTAAEGPAGDHAPAPLADHVNAGLALAVGLPRARATRPRLLAATVAAALTAVVLLQQ